MCSKGDALDLPWLDESFLQAVLQNESENTGKSVKIHKFNAEFASKTGDNYSSLLYRVHVTYSTDNTSGEVNKSYIVKYMYPLDTSHGAMMKSLNAFNKEVSMYTETLPLIHDTIKATGLQCQFSPRCLFHVREPYELIVIEDLSTEGYQMAVRQNGLDLHHCKNVVGKLAKMHAVSMFLNKQNPKFRTNYNRGIFHSKTSDTLKVYFENGILQAIELMKTIPELQKYVNFYEDYHKSFFQHGLIGQETIPDDCFDFNVLIHGDFWINNMMFKYNNDGSLNDIKFVDFQQPFFSNPGHDLNYFLFTSPTDEVRSFHRDDILEEYYTELKKMLIKLNYTGPIPTLKELYAALLKNRFIALMTVCIVLPLVKLDKSNNDMTADAIMDDKESAGRIALFSNTAYHESLIKCLNDLEKMGFVEKFN